MIITIKVVLLIILILTVFGVIAEKGKEKRGNLTIISLTNIVALVILEVFA